jgi:hypothetical protein
MLDKTEIVGFVKDRETGLVINTKNEELQAYRAARQKSKNMKALEERVGNMETELKDINSNLSLILEALRKDKKD